MTRTRVALLTAGDPERMTGGYLFHRRMANAAARHAAELSFVTIPDLPLAWAIATGPLWLRDPGLRGADVAVIDSIAAAAAAPWLRALGVPIVGMLHQVPGGMEASRQARRVRASFDRWSYRRADLLMVASEWLAEELLRAGFGRARLRLVLPGKDAAPCAQPPGFGPARDRSAPSVGGGEHAALRAGRRIAAMCVANWLPRKGIVELLDAVAGLPDGTLTLHLVGDDSTNGAYARRVRARLGQPDLRLRVVVHGSVPPARVAEMYRHVDAFILPSYVEPYGTVWGEAMAAGLPVIGWRAGNLPFLADDGREAFMVPPGDVPALREAIRLLASDGALRDRMGRAAALRSSDRPTWDETATRFFGVIEEVLARRRSPAQPTGADPPLPRHRRPRTR